jgi:MoaA/NifB/PqqE/SkfB family radical SAM enzyme
MNRLFAGIIRKAAFLKYNLRPFRPSLVASHALKRLSSKFHFRKNGFRIIDLAITYDCNLRCEHCSAMVLAKDEPKLTLSDYRRIVQQAKQLDVLSWNITGGEPLLVDWLDELIPILEPRRHYISIQSNCNLLTESRARALADLGVNCITTSIDSILPQEHDRFRGVQHTYARTLEGLANARKAGMQILVGGIVTHQNLRSRELELLIKQSNQLGAIFLFNLAVPCGKWAGNYDSILRGDDREYLLRLMNKYPLTTTDHEVGRNAVGCPAGMEKLYITNTGEVIPCPFIHITFGNVRDEPLAEIVEEMQKVPYFGRYQNICVAAEDGDFHKQALERVYASGKPIPVHHTDIF